MSACGMDAVAGPRLRPQCGLTAMPTGLLTPAPVYSVEGESAAPELFSSVTLLACATLFSSTTPPVGSAPADVATALLDMANNPTNNVAPFSAWQRPRLPSSQR